MFLKNTYGYSVEIKSFILEEDGLIKEFGGSSLDRKKSPPKKDISDKVSNNSENNSNEIDSYRLGEIAAEMSMQEITVPEPEIKKERQMSSHTKSKIRKKILAWSQVHKNLYFLTLTFLNKVEDELAVNILRKFLDNLKKRKKGFQYLWVAERQKKNIVFPDNIHFHLITNKSIDIKKYVKYWIDLQNKNGVHARDKSFNPGSALDIRKINTANIKTLSQYMTKYVTKNIDTFDCQVWNCSKHISVLYTSYYTGGSFLNDFRRVANVTEKVIKHDKFETKLHFIQLDKTTMRMYNKLDDKNREVLSQFNEINN